MRLVKCLTQGERSRTIPSEAIADEFDVIKHLEAQASASEAAKELQSAWREWNLILDEVVADKIDGRRLARMNLAGMDFKRQKLYVFSVHHPPLPEPLKGARREPSLEFFHVRSSLTHVGFTFLRGLSVDWH